MAVDRIWIDKRDSEYKACISCFKSGENALESEKSNFFTSQQFSTSFRKHARNELFLTMSSVMTTETRSKISYPVHILRNVVLPWIYKNLGQKIFVEGIKVFRAHSKYFLFENGDRNQEYMHINVFNNITIITNYNYFLYFCTHSNAIWERTTEKGKSLYFTFTFFFNVFHVGKFTTKFLRSYDK